MTSVDGQIAGAVRLCPESGVSVLRGRQVGKRFQRQGIGTLLLAACRPYLDGRESFCLPYAHLLPFYASSGFQASEPAQLPDFLARRLASYRARGHQDMQARGAGFKLGASAINSWGYDLLRGGMVAESVAIFEFGTRLVPEDANLFDSLGEAQEAAGRKEDAVRSYRRSLELNPKNSNAVARLKALDVKLTGLPPK